MRVYSIEERDMLYHSREHISVDGLDIILKKSPVAAPGHMDKYEIATLGDSIDTVEKAEEAKNKTYEERVAEYKKYAGGYPNRCLNTAEMVVKYEELMFGCNQVGLWRYYKKRSENPKRPCLVYIHGGGWMGGDVYYVEYNCRYVAEYGDAVVFNIDYSLAPEKPYPNGLNDCYHALLHIYDHAEEYGINPDRIVIAGDSAGGNLAAACALKARDERKEILKGQFLIYPAVLVGDSQPEGYQWKKEFYDISQEENELISSRLAFGLPVPVEDDFIAKAYVGCDERAKEAYVSPALASSHEGLPKTVIVDAEYDGLRLQDEYYGRLLWKAGVDVKILRYTGVSHGFMDCMGIVPQCEEVCMEMVDFIKGIGE